MLCRSAFWFVGLPWQIWQSRKLLRQEALAQLMVINGGYPGGDACLAATLAWATLGGKRRAWHNFHNLALPYPTSLPRRIKERLTDALIARYARGFISVSRACLASLAKQRPVFSGKPAFAIYNGINPISPEPSSDLRRELELPAHARIILMLGVYELRKGHAFAIDVMEVLLEQCPDAWLLACGDGSETEIGGVRARRDPSPARDRIILQGHRYDLANLLAQADVLIMPSQAQESFGYTVAEAMACGVPVVASDIGGLPEVVAHEVTGYVVHHDDVQLFASSIATVLLNPAVARRMGELGRQRYQDNFQALRMGMQYHELLVRGLSRLASEHQPHLDRNSTP